ncbi:helix-turn-helix domain-containing protein [Micromonospora sp. NBC_01796]|uniref:helix-turn-helix domain-containing protein n=1 Tax=Micromonospora sp. NBC_01796 TaxID=2975987 RepID=UPI002DD9B1A8|nr:Scr1 family TA system antitoxin-like transcriptional regulator [Micromonospora sp. NBC_01796]WSA87278.1 Scr1 family TA system antitoxin-like transcriptional regulator [Micromonospora sp. NBC_01796]
MNSLSARLKQLRAERAVTQDQVADAIQVSSSLIAAFETNRLVPQPDTAATLDGYFGTGDEIQVTSTEARKERRPAPNWFRPWREVEDSASLLRYFQATLIPGLLQTEAYAQAVFAGSGTLTADEVASRVAYRMERQSGILDRDQPPFCAFIVDESALRCGRSEIARDQLKHLADASDRTNLFVHVVPGAAGLYVGRSGSFALGTMLGGGMVGYLEDFYEGRVVAEPTRVGGLDRTWQAITAVALPCDQSRDLILKLVDE